MASTAFQMAATVYEREIGEGGSTLDVAFLLL